MQNTLSQQTAAPILESLHSAYSLYRDSREKRPETRMQLTGLVSDLMELELSEKELNMVADVLIALAKQAEVDLRKAIAERISSIDKTPLKLVMHIANDEIEVARPVLKNSPVLSDASLIDIINANGSDHWQTIAQRSSIGDIVINKLADTGDFPTGTALVENATITLTKHSVKALAEMAKESEVLAQPLLRRAEIPDDIASQLYTCVGQSLKKFILKNYEVNTKALMDTIDDVIIEFVDSPDAVQVQDKTLDKKDELLPTQSMLNAAMQFKNKGLLTIQLMLNTLRRGQIPSFVAQFANYCELQADNAVELMHQTRARGLAVVCKAQGVGRSDFISFYLLTNTTRSSGHMIDFKEMGNAVGLYDKTEPEIARKIISQSMEKLLTDA